MDPLSVTASVIAVLQLTQTAVSYLNDIKNASKDQRKYTVEASNIFWLLTCLKNRLEDASDKDLEGPWYNTVRALAVENGPLDQYMAVLERLVAKTRPKDGAAEARYKLLWTFRSAEAAQILENIERLKTLIIIALEMDHLSVTIHAKILCKLTFLQ